MAGVAIGRRGGEARRGDFFLRAAIFGSLLRTSVQSEQSLAAASRFRSSTLLFLLLLEQNLLKFVDRATLAAHR